MGELERLRDSREIRVSRSHLFAAAAIALLLAASTFGLGVALGRSKIAVTSDGAPVTLVDGVPGDELVELLAEVERGRVLHASQAMTYPQFFAGEGAVQVPDAAPKPAPVDAVVQAAPSVGGSATDPIPAGPYTVHVGNFVVEAEVLAARELLTQSGLPVWTSVRLDGGKPTWIVGVGSYSAEADAVGVREQADRALSAAPGVHEIPAIVGVSTL